LALAPLRRRPQAVPPLATQPGAAGWARPRVSPGLQPLRDLQRVRRLPLGRGGGSL